jgi:hypothetical protein
MTYKSLTPSNCAGNRDKMNAIRGLLNLVDKLLWPNMYHDLGMKLGSNKLILVSHRRIRYEDTSTQL